MASATADFASWIEQADIPQSRLTPQVLTLLGAVYRFRQSRGCDYYSNRLLSHFLLHCDCGLKVAQVARLVGVSRPHASAQQGASSKDVIRLAHHRLRGRPHGKLLPRFAGPIAGFLLGHPDSTRAELLDFIEANFSVRVSRIALYKFLKKFGLDQVPGPAQPEAPAGTTHDTSVPGPPQAPTAVAASAAPPELPVPPPAAAAPAEQPGRILLPGPTLTLAPVPPPPFCSAAPSTPAPSC